MKNLKFLFVFLIIILLSQLCLAPREVDDGNLNPSQNTYWTKQNTPNLNTEEVKAQIKEHFNNPALETLIARRSEALQALYDKPFNIQQSILENPQTKFEEDKLVMYNDEGKVEFELDLKNPAQEPKIEKTEEGYKYNGHEFQNANNVQFIDNMLRALAPNTGIQRIVLDPQQPIDYAFTGTVNYLQDGDTILVNVVNPISQNNRLFVDHAQQVTSADLVVAGDNIFRNIKDSTFELDDQGKLISADITSSTDNNLQTIAKPEVKIILNKDSHLLLKDQEFTLTKGTISFETLDFTETITTTGQSKISLDFSQLTGFYSLTLSKDAEYGIEYNQNPEMSFKIIPETDNYIIYINKAGENNFDFESGSTDWAFIDMPSKTIKLNSKADFYKASGNGNSDFIKLIESNNQDNEFTLTFDTEFIYFDAKLSNDNVLALTENTVIANIYLGNYQLSETIVNVGIDENSIHTIASFSHQPNPDYINSYSHGDTTINLVNGNLLQQTETNTINLFSTNQNLQQEILEYKPDYCNIYNTNENYIESLFTENQLNANVIGSTEDAQPSFAIIFASLLFLSILTITKLRKKSQISLFIIVGIVLLVIIMIMFAIVMNVESSTTSTMANIDTSSVQLYMDSCLSQLAQCSILHQGLNYGQITLTTQELNKAIFESNTQNFLDTNAMECYNNMPYDLKQDVKVNTFESKVHYNSNTIIDIYSDMTARNDFSEQGVSDYQTSLPIQLNNLINFANTIQNIDLTLLGQSNYDINIYNVDSKPLYIITDSGSIVFDKEFKLIK